MKTNSSSSSVEGEWLGSSFLVKIPSTVAWRQSDDLMQLLDFDCSVIVDRRKRSMANSHRWMKSGCEISARVDLPSYLRHGLYVVTVHRRSSASTIGKVIGYQPSAWLHQASFWSREDLAALIAMGVAKSPMAAVNGTYQHGCPSSDMMRSQVTFNPKVASYFYDRKTGQEVVGAKSAFLSGPTVYCEGVEYGDRNAGCDPFLLRNKGAAVIEEADIKRLIKQAVARGISFMRK